MINGDVQFRLAASRTEELVQEASYRRLAAIASGALATGSARKGSRTAGLLFHLKDTRLSELRESWRGRRVLDRYARTIGKVGDVLVESRSVDDCIREDGDPHAWGVRARYAAVHLGSGWLARFFGRTILIPIWKLTEEGDVLRADEDLIQIRLTVA